MEPRRCLDTGLAHAHSATHQNLESVYPSACWLLPSSDFWRPWPLTPVTTSSLRFLLHRLSQGYLYLVWPPHLIWSQGLCEGVTYPSLNPHISRWVPSSERSRFDSTCYQTKATLLQQYFRFTSFVFLGGTAGTVLTLPVSGILLNNYPWEVKKCQKFFGTRI